jgi:hypothetical protein
VAVNGHLGTGALIREGLRAVFRPPYALLLGLSSFVYLVQATVSDGSDGASLLFGLLLAVVSAYVQIACTLAAGAPEPSNSADTWFVAAIRRRCFLRFVAVELATIALMVVGLALLIVGAFVVGGVVALAQPAAVLERRGPIDAIKRSAVLGRDVRGPLTVVFGVFVLVPGVALQAAYAFGLQETAGVALVAAGLLGVVLALAGTISLTSLFVALGGAPTPPLQEMAPERPFGAGRGRDGPR